MLTSRNVIIAAVAISTLSLLAALISVLASSPGSGGRGKDSYGTRAFGYRGLFETMDELGWTVRREIAPPTGELDTDDTLVFLEPHSEMAIGEPAYLHDIRDWMERGGRVVVALGGPIDPLILFILSIERRKVSDAPLVSELGFKDISVKRLGHTIDNSELDDGESDSFSGAFDEMRDALGTAARPVNMQVRNVELTGAGSMAPVAQQAAQLDIPLDCQYLELKDEKPSGTLTFQDAESDGSERMLAATFPVGQGELVVVSDCRLWQNRVFVRSDNSVLAANLLAHDRQLVFDEFYHDQIVRGNPLWLLTRPAYLWGLVALLTAVGLWNWRQAAFLGPPLAAAPKGRRSIMEYVDALAHLLVRSRRSPPVLLREIRDGVVSTIAHELGLAAGPEHADEVVAVLKRRDPSRAQRLADSLRKVDEVLAKPRSAKTEIVIAMKRMSACL